MEHGLYLEWRSVICSIGTLTCVVSSPPLWGRLVTLLSLGAVMWWRSTVALPLRRWSTSRQGRNVQCNCSRCRLGSTLLDHPSKKVGISLSQLLLSAWWTSWRGGGWLYIHGRIGWGGDLWEDWALGSCLPYCDSLIWRLVCVSTNGAKMIWYHLDVGDVQSHRKGTREKDPSHTR